MCVLRLIATADVAATEAETEMNPGVPDRQTLAAADAVRLDLLDHAQVLTGG
jgi:hypothetical protein